MYFIKNIFLLKAAYKGHVDVIRYFLDLNSNDIKINCKDN